MKTEKEQKPLLQQKYYTEHQYKTNTGWKERKSSGKNKRTALYKQKIIERDGPKRKTQKHRGQEQHLNVNAHNIKNRKNTEQAIAAE